MNVIEEKKITTIRLSPSTKSKLDLAAFSLKCSKTKIIEEALQEWFDRRNISEKYDLIDGILTEDNE